MAAIQNEAADRTRSLEEQVATLQATLASLELQQEQRRSQSTTSPSRRETEASLETGAAATAVATDPAVKTDEGPEGKPGETVDDVLDRLSTLALLQQEQDEAERQAANEEEARTQEAREQEQAAFEAKIEHEVEKDCESQNSQPEEPTMQDEIEVEEPPVLQKAAPAEEAHDDESIEDYMARLLNRMRSGQPGSGSANSGDSQPAKAEAPPRPAQSPTEKPQGDRKPAVESTQPAAAPAAKPVAKPFPRSAPPELSDLAAMRAIANSQARTAITQHQKSRWAKDALSKSMWAGLTVVTSLVVLIFAPEGFMFLQIGAGIGIAAGLYFLYGAAKVSKHFLAESKKNLKPAPIEAEQTDAPAETADAKE